MTGRTWGRAERDVAMIEDGDRWPLWPRLPLKRGPNNNELGVLMHAEPSGYLCFHINMFQDITKDTPATRYATADAVVRDGWKVD